MTAGTDRQTTGGLGVATVQGPVTGKIATWMGVAPSGCPNRR